MLFYRLPKRPEKVRFFPRLPERPDNVQLAEQMLLCRGYENKIPSDIAVITDSEV